MTDGNGPQASADTCLRTARARIEASEAALLLAHVLGRSRGWLYAHGDAPVPARDQARFEQLVARRAAGEPVAYLLGTRGFWRFDLVASNPPYIAEGDAHLAQGDLRFEPRGALASGVDGLEAIRAIAAGASAHLRDGGWLLVEHGWEQGTAVRALFEAAGLVDVATERDLGHRERVTLGRR
jgi:methylase of polypeptide subunit release factors